MLGLGWAANRVWVVIPYRDVPVALSARLSGGTLTGFAQARVPDSAGSLLPIREGQLVLGGVDGTEGSFTAPLLADGRVGPRQAVPEDLLARTKSAAPKLATVGVVDGVRAGNRVVWALAGAEAAHGIGGSPLFFLVCCSESGAAVDLTRLIDRKTGPFLPQIGLDSHGRIWLAWLDRRSYSRAARGVPRMIELDPSTLQPRTTAASSPGLVSDSLVLACASACRLVAQTAAGDIVSWAPGERAIRVATHTGSKKLGIAPAWLLNASYRSGHLVVAYHGIVGPRNRPRDDLRVIRGDERGLHRRVVGVLQTTYGWPAGKLYPPNLDPVIYATFVPAGLVAIELFRFSKSYSPLIGAVVPLGQ